MSQSIFCCGSAAPFEVPEPVFFNPLRIHHNGVFTSFLAFAIRSGRPIQQSEIIKNSKPGQDQDSMLQAPGPTPPVSPENSKASAASNVATTISTPFMAQTPFTIHLETRNDFGPVISHRYFVLPLNNNREWIEATQMQYWQASGNFVHVAAKVAHKCPAHNRFFKVELRPNLELRKTFSPFEGSGAVVQGQG